MPSNRRPEKKKNTLHVHGCPGCHARFEDACDDMWSDPLCGVCAGRTAYLAPWHARTPVACCFTDTVDVTLSRDQTIAKKKFRGIRERWKLGSSCRWFKCQTCSRTFPFAAPRADTSATSTMPGGHQ